jgi:hypothetical protein
VTISQHHASLVQGSPYRPGVHVHLLADLRERFARVVETDCLANLGFSKSRVAARHALTAHVLDDGVLG